MFSPAKLSAAGRRLFDVIDIDEGERLYCEIRKHPIGLYSIYLVGFAVAAMLLAAAVAVALLLNENTFGLGMDLTGYRLIVALLGVLLAGLTAVATVIGGHLL